MKKLSILMVMLMKMMVRMTIKKKKTKKKGKRKIEKNSYDDNGDENHDPVDFNNGDVYSTATTTYGDKADVKPSLTNVVLFGSFSSPVYPPGPMRVQVKVS